jgi:hypothetical protein
VSKATSGYLDQCTWHRMVRWIRKRHNRMKWAVLLRRGQGVTIQRSFKYTSDGQLSEPGQVTALKQATRCQRDAVLP